MNLQDYLMNIQAEQMGQSRPIPPQQMPESVPYAPMRRNPIQAGAQAGMQAARESMALSDDQQRRAMGHGMVQMAAHMARPLQPGMQTGFAGNIGRMTEALSPAAEAYRMERANAEKANYSAYAEDAAQRDRSRQRDDHAAAEILKDLREKEHLKYLKSSANSGTRGSSYAQLQEEKHIRLLKKDERDLIKTMENEVTTRMKDVRAIGDEKRSAARKHIEEEVVKKYAPHLAEIQESKNRYSRTAAPAPKEQVREVPAPKLPSKADFDENSEAYTDQQLEALLKKAKK